MHIPFLGAWAALVLGALLLTGSGKAEAEDDFRNFVLEAFAGQHPGVSGLTLARNVNRRLNQLKQRSDIDTWGHQDYWATPDDLLRRGAGDCEDLAIAKFFALLQLGVPEDRLWLARGVRLNPWNSRLQSHLVTVYEDRDGTPWVLDNLSPEPYRLDAQQRFIADLGFDLRSWWKVGGTKGARSKPGGPSDEVRKWQELRMRMSADAEIIRYTP